MFRMLVGRPAVHRRPPVRRATATRNDSSNSVNATTIAAVECRPKVAPVSRVGFHYFERSEQASAAYMSRIRDEGLNLDDRARASRYEGPMWDCDDEVESASIAPDPKCEQFREAGFINGSGYANYRAVFDRLYIGILGTTDDVKGLRNWAWSSEHWPEPPPGEMGEVPEVPTLYEGKLAWPFHPAETRAIDL